MRMPNGSILFDQGGQTAIVSTKKRIDTIFLILFSGITLIGILILSCIIGLWTLHSDELSSAQINLNRISRILSEQTALAFHEIDTVTKESRLYWQETPDAPPRVLHDQLHRIFQGFLQGQALLVFGPDGKMRAHSRVFPTPDVDATDRDYFKAHAGSPDDSLYISKPLRNRVNNHWMISLSRRLSSPDGEFAGVIMAAIEMHYFERLYRELDFSPDTQVTLKKTDGTVLATYPVDETRLGTVQPPEATGPDTLVATSILADLPLEISLSLTRKTALRRWYVLAWALCPGTLVAALGLGVLTARLMDNVKKDRDQAHTQQQRLEDLVRLRTGDLQDMLEFNKKVIDASPVGIAVYAHDGQCVTINDVFCRILDMDKEQVLSRNFKSLTMLYPSGIAQYARQTLDSGLTSQHEGYFDTPEGKRTWLDFQIVRFTRHNIHHVLLLLRDITERKRMVEKLRTLAFTDSLTGVNNRRRFLELARNELKRARRHDRPFAFLILDIDYFKDINDSHGHDQGDVVLKKLATTCLRVLRDIDIFGRLGGEEFGAVLVETDLEQASAIAERLRATVADDSLDIDGARVTLTVSIGVAVWRETDTSFSDLMLQADKALYTAKNQGRNRVVAV
jgi:diguanylate cyclase (GGDEF)-like protein/PAS domain S-box-containing protein